MPLFHNRDHWAQQDHGWRVVRVRSEGEHGGAGFIETPMNAWLRNDPANAGQVEAINSFIPARRYGSGREVAEAVVFLVGASGSYITGQTLFVDGGWSVV